MAQGKKDERLAEAAKLTRGGTEEEVRKGADLCAEIDSPESMELALALLRGPQPHFRDIAWEALPNFKSPYARALVAEELAKGKGGEGVRQWCAELLGLYGDLSASDVLTKALGDKFADVRAAAAQALGRVGARTAIKALAKTASDKDPIVRAYAREALAKIDAKGHTETLLAGLADEDGGVRCFTLGVLDELAPEHCAPRSAAALGDPDWRVRLVAARNLQELRPPESIQALIDACEDTRPIVARCVLDALAALTGQHWSKKLQWMQWWESQKGSFDPAAPSPAPSAGDAGPRTVAARYHDLPIESDHVAFLVDASETMKERLESTEGTKEEVARKEFARVLEVLEGKLVFNVFLYDVKVAAFADAPVALDARTRKKAQAFVDGANNRGAKDIYSALLRALADTELDTVYLFASGEPEVGLYVHHNRIVWRLKELERFHPVVIHGVAYNKNDWYRRQIEEIARATGGEFRAVE